MTTAARQRWLWGATGLGLVALFVVSGFWSTAGADGPIFCLFRRASGIACPGCGLTRAAGLAASGRFTESFATHPLFVLIAAEIAAGWWLWGERLRGRGERAARLVAPAVVATATLLVLIWLARFASGTLPS
jgi:hypothetical protein